MKIRRKGLGKIINEHGIHTLHTEIARVLLENGSANYSKNKKRCRKSG